MIRKKTALLFILLANIVLLAHAVVPHHHHKGLFCTEVTNCQIVSEDHRHHLSEPTHEHNGDKSAENCVLKQIVVVPVNSLRHEFKCVVCDDNHALVDDFQAVLSKSEPLFFVPSLVSNAQIVSNFSPQSIFALSSIGLRAPPSV